MRVVLDTDVVIAALRSPRGASAAILRMVEDGQCTMLLSVALALEYQAKCILSEHRVAAKLTEQEAAAFITTLVELAEPVHMWFLWRPQLQDPGDEMVLETAVNGRADALITFNLRDYAGVTAKFGITVLQPRDALRRLRT